MSTEPAPISFARGAPSLDIIDVEGLKAAADRAFTNDPARTFGYGTSVGYPPLRQWVAEKHGVDVDQVLLTNGSLQADAFLFNTLVDTGDTVVVESPSYDRTLGSLQDRQADLHALTLESDGVSVDAMRNLLAAGTPVKLAHLIPNFQNPAGYTLAASKREELVTMARESGMTIFEDDPYVELRFTGDRLPTMLSRSTNGEVVYASSFSKTVAPGIRVGYLIGQADLIGRIASLATSTYISPNMVAQSIVYEFIRGGSFEKSINTVTAALSRRLQVLSEELTQKLPQARFVMPEGGYFMWVSFDEDVDGDVLAQRAAERGLAVVKGSDFRLDGAKNSLRLAYSGVDEEQIRDGVTRLAEAYHTL